LPVLEAAEIDIAAVFLDCGPNAGFEKFFDHGDDFGVVFVVGERVDFRSALALLVAFVCDCVDNGRPRGQDFVDDGEDFGLDVCPGRGGVFGHGDVVNPQEDGSYAVDVEELRSERGGMWGCEGRAWAEVFEEGRRDGFGEDALVGIKFESLG
jgi:hypothetical protein